MSAPWSNNPMAPTPTRRAPLHIEMGQGGVMKRWLSLGWFVTIAIGGAFFLPPKGLIVVGGIAAFITVIFITFHAGINLKEWWDKSVFLSRRKRLLLHRHPLAHGGTVMRKFLTLMARTRTLLKRSTDKLE